MYMFECNHQRNHTHTHTPCTNAHLNGIATGIANVDLIEIWLYVQMDLDMRTYPRYMSMSTSMCISRYKHTYTVMYTRWFGHMHVHMNMYICTHVHV